MLKKINNKLNKYPNYRGINLIARIRDRNHKILNSLKTNSLVSPSITSMRTKMKMSRDMVMIPMELDLTINIMSLTDKPRINAGALIKEIFRIPG